MNSQKTVSSDESPQCVKALLSPIHRPWHLSLYSVFAINEHYPLDAGDYTSIFIAGNGITIIVFYNLQMNLTINKNIFLGLIGVVFPW